MSKRFWYFYICEDCKEAIQQRLDTIKAFKNPYCRTCYNIRKGKENRDKISKTLNGRKLTSEHCKNITLGMLSREISKETRIKISNSQPYKGKHIQTNTGRTHFLKKELHPQWKGGISFIRGEDWDKIRKSIYKRDKYKCRNCSKYGKLNCHHIIPYRKTEDNSEENLITLCQSCHSKLEMMYDNICKRPKYFEVINVLKIGVL